MDLQHIAIKVFVDGDLTVDWEQFINVFHEWTAEQSMPEMMIDVADYRHVPNGPGVVLVGHDADYYMDNTDGQPGLRYVSKAKQNLDNAAQVKQAFDRVASACARLEAKLEGLKFSRTDVEVTINDRAIAPNNDSTRAMLSNELPGLLETAIGHAPAKVTVQQEDRKLAGARVHFSEPVELVAL